MDYLFTIPASFHNDNLESKRTGLSLRFLTGEQERLVQRLDDRRLPQTLQLFIKRRCGFNYLTIFEMDVVP